MISLANGMTKLFYTRGTHCVTFIITVAVPYHVFSCCLKQTPTEGRFLSIDGCTVLSQAGLSKPSKQIENQETVNNHLKRKPCVPLNIKKTK